VTSAAITSKATSAARLEKATLGDLISIYSSSWTEIRRFDEEDGTRRQRPPIAGRRKTALTGRRSVRLPF